MASASTAPAQRSGKPLLESRADVSEQKACLDEKGIGYKDEVPTAIKSVRIDLRLNLVHENKGDLPIILDKQGGTVWRYTIYQENTDSTPGEKVYEADFQLIFVGEAAKEGERPGERFAILHKGESLTMRSETRLLFDYANNYPPYDGGLYFISFGVYAVGGDLSQTNTLAELRRKWTKTGFFWFESVKTKPVSMPFPSAQSLKTCD